MKKLIKYIAIICMSTHVLSAYGQELTAEQQAADKARSDAVVQDEKAAAILANTKANIKLTPQQAEKLALRLAVEQAKMDELILPTNSIFGANKKTSTLQFSSTMSSVMDLNGYTLQNNGEGIKFNKTIIDPYTTYGIAPVSSWQTFFSYGQYYPWHIVTRTLVPTNGPAAGSYDQTQMPTEAVSYMYTDVTNHFDQYGDPVWHTISAWYEAYGSLVFYGQVFRCAIGTWYNHGEGSTNLPMSSSWSRFTMMVPPLTTSPNYIYFVQFQGTQKFGASPSGEVDNSVQWMPYQPDFVGLKYSSDNSNNMTLSWDIYYQTTNHWFLTYADNLLGPWASNTVPISISGNIGNVSFKKVSNNNRFYRLAHH